MARQGVGYPTVAGLMVADPGTMQPVAQDGATMGELMMRGNTVMKGYLANPEATAKTLVGDWYLSGDLAVWHPDGYIEIKDRSKDIIISGGENISSLEVEEVLSQHPAVLLAAVVARPDPTWGETPCAFLELKADADAVDEAAIIQFCRQRLARFKVPKRVIFELSEDLDRQNSEIRAARTGRSIITAWFQCRRSMQSGPPEGQSFGGRYNRLSPDNSRPRLSMRLRRWGESLVGNIRISRLLNEFRADQPVADGCRASGKTLICMNGNNGRPDRMLCNSSWSATSKMLMFAYSPATRHRWSHLPLSCSSCARCFSAAFSRPNTAGSPSVGIRTSMRT